MSKIKTRDLIVIGAFLFVGFFIYLFFFTDIVTGMVGIKSNVVEKPKTGNSKFEGFNTSVEEKKGVEYGTKAEVYEAELLADQKRLGDEQQRGLDAQKAQGMSETNQINDLTEIINGKAEKKGALANLSDSRGDLVLASPSPTNQGVPIVNKPTRVLKKVVPETAVVVQEKEKLPVQAAPVRTRRSYAAIGTSGNMGESAGEGPEKNGPSAFVINCKALIHNEQKIFTGGPIVMRLVEDMKLDNVVVPRNTFVTGIVNFSGQRASLTVNTVTVKGVVYPVTLQGYDGKDGVEGLYVPVSTNQEISRDGIVDAVSVASQALRVPILQRTLGNAGQRKVQEQTVSFPSGYELILKSRQ